MPLHLLSKKSWNVYSPANRAKVARDEALAEAAERDAERQRRDEASTSRIDRLRDGTEDRRLEDSSSGKLSEQDKLIEKATEGLRDAGRESRKRKRIPGEDDTDRDMRYAREREEQRSQGFHRSVARIRATQDEDLEAPLVDSKGHINLFPEKKPPRTAEISRKTELEKQKEQYRASEEDHGMHLKDALGHKAAKGAWYIDKDGGIKDSVGHDVWGNEDPRRRQREARRMASSDPLAFMKQAQTQLKEARREREDRQRELERSRTAEDRELEDFSLDAGTDEREEKHRKRHRDSHPYHSYHTRDGSRNRTRTRDRSRSHEPRERDYRRHRYRSRSRSRSQDRNNKAKGHQRLHS